MDNEIKLLSIMFSLLDMIEYEYPQLRDEVLNQINNVYSADIVDTINCYLDHNWADIDNVNAEDVIVNYLSHF